MLNKIIKRVGESLHFTSKNTIQIAPNNGPRWKDIHQQNSIFVTSLKRIPEIWNFQALQLKSFLHLMITCKEIYNYYINWLPVKSTISITFNEPVRFENYQFLKSIFEQQNNSPNKFNMGLSYFQHTDRKTYTYIIQDKINLTLLINSDAELTAFTKLLKKKLLSEEQLHILRQSKFKFCWLNDSIVDYQGLVGIVKHSWGVATI